MTNLSQKSIDELKALFKTKYGKELTDAEASESAYNLIGYVELVWKIATEDAKRQHRLKKEPTGFHLADGTYNCRICGRAITGDESWYDSWGTKCRLCQKAVTEGVVPGFVCKELNSHYKMWELKDKFQIHPQTARKMIRLGELKARIILSEDGKPYEYLFLKKENPHLISRYPPERKSYDRHRKKEDARQLREWQQQRKKFVRTPNPISARTNSKR